MPVAEKKTSHPFISLGPKLAGGQPVIRGTRMKVIEIAIRYEFMGLSPDAIIDEYPFLKLEQVHDALSYYYEHKAALDKNFREDDSLIEKLKKRHPSKLLSEHASGALN
jgi:uncharacterized protein (DUF433 family)